MQGLAPRSLASQALAQRAGVLVRGPGTGTSDSIPAALSDGELVIPADDVRRYGAAQIMAQVKQGGQNLPQPAMVDGTQHAAAGGLIADPFGPQTNDVTRVGNSYSGGNIGGNITVNGQAPGGTVSTYSAPRAPAPPGQPQPLGTPGSLASRAALSAPGGAQAAPGAAAPGQVGQPLQSLAAGSLSAVQPATNPAAPRSMAGGGQISWSGRPQQPSGVEQLVGALAQLARQPAAPQVPGQQQLRSTDQQFFNGGALGYANGGLVSEDDLRRPLAEQAQVRAVDNLPQNAAAIAAAQPSMAGQPGSLAQRAMLSSSAPDDQVAAANRAGAQTRSLAALAMEQAQQGVGVPSTPGLTIIGPADYANRNANFNDSAQLRTVLARGPGPGRNGAAAFAQQVQGAAMPLAQRAQQEALQVKEQGDTARAQLQEQGLAVRAAAQDRRLAESNGIQRERLQFEAAREDRAQTQALSEQERKARIAQIDELIVSGSPEQKKAAAAQKAALMGKGLDDVGKVGEVSTGIRKEFEGLPEVKAFKQALPAFKGIEDAAKRNTPMSDINMVYGIAKLYDPNSVVREGEYATVANAPNMPERVKGWVSYVSGGGKLTPEVKGQILAEARSRMGTFDREYGATISRYGDIARRSGADASLVVPQDYQPMQQPQQTELPQLTELRRRAANNPQLAQRLQAAGY